MWSDAALLGVLLSAVNPVLGAGALAAAQTAQLKYSRDFEQEADYLGLRIAAHGGYDPTAGIALLQAASGRATINPAGARLHAVAPVTEERVAHIESVIDAQKLRSPRGRPAASPELAEVQAVLRVPHRRPRHGPESSSKRR